MRFSSDHIADIKRWGFRRFLYSALMWRIEKFFSLSSIFIRKLEVEPILPPLGSGREVRLASPSELFQAAKDPALKLDSDFVREALQRNELCPAVFEQGEILAYAWRAVQATPHTSSLIVVFPSTYQYSFKAFTHPSFRRQNLQHAISMYTDPMFIDQGCEHVISFIATHNYPSIMSNLSRGNIIVGYAGYLKLWGKVFCFRTRGAKRVGFKFVNNH